MHEPPIFHPICCILTTTSFLGRLNNGCFHGEDFPDSFVGGLYLLPTQSLNVVDLLDGLSSKNEGVVITDAHAILDTDA